MRTLIFPFFFLALTGATTVIHANTFKEETLFHQGIAREYRWYGPQLKAASKAPLLFVFHGGGGTAAGVDATTFIIDKALAKGFYVVLPQGLKRRWNDGRAELPSETDDVGFVDQLLSRFTAEFPIDSKAVFATGISNGGAFTFRLACDRSEKFRAIATVAMNLTETLSVSCHAKPLSVLLIEGDSDPLVPFGGGAITLPFPFPLPRGRVISSDDTLQFWGKNNGCDSKTINTKNLPGSTGTIKTVHEKLSCPPAFPVERYVVKGGGHTWPGGSQYLPPRIVGALATDWSASDMILNFFEDAMLSQSSEAALANKPH